MFKSECLWFQQKVADRSDEVLFPVLNLGSSTLEYRTLAQPYVDSLLFGPLQARGTVLHQDQKYAPGVDLVGDLFDPQHLAQLTAVRAGTVFFTSVLAHVADPVLACRRVEDLTPPGALLCVSALARYPICADPIDNGIRPSPAQLAALFPRCEVLCSALIEEPGSSFIRGLLASPRALALFCLRLLAPWHRPRNWWRQVLYLPWIGKAGQVSCLVMRRSTTEKIPRLQGNAEPCIVRNDSKRRENTV